MVDVLGDSIDIALYGFNVDDGEEIDNSLMSTFGYIAFTPTSTGYIPDHTERALDLLIEEFRKDKPKLHGLIASFTDSLQEVENVLFDLLRFRSISSAGGAQLDGIGDILGLPRTSGDDDVYRVDLIFKIFINISSGQPEILIQVLDNLVNASTIDYTESYPASVLLIINQAALPLPDNLTARMQTLTPAGVGINIYFNNTETTFVFGREGSLPPAYAGEGFGETGVGNEGIGGNFTEVIST